MYSEGLLQLSYQDMEAHPDLRQLFNWEHDKTLAPTDCSKSILDPFINLSAGIVILADQVRREKAIVLNNPYWSTLGELPKWAKHSKVTEIAAMVGKMPITGKATNSGS